MQKQTKQGYRLSPQQEHLWLLEGRSPGAQYHALCAVAIRGKLHKETLKCALATVVRRHEILRTSFRVLHGMMIPLQVISGDAPVDLREVDLSRLNAQTQEARIDALCEEIGNEYFDPKQETPLRACLAAKSNREHTLILGLPALCADRATLRNVARELA
ncbi:MAG TPA: condensation domain-containing protein, partial [Blastocatellia bacterium]